MHSGVRVERYRRNVGFVDSVGPGFHNFPGSWIENRRQSSPRWMAPEATLCLPLPVPTSAHFQTLSENIQTHSENKTPPTLAFSKKSRMVCRRGGGHGRAHGRLKTNRIEKYVSNLAPRVQSMCIKMKKKKKKKSSCDLSSSKILSRCLTRGNKRQRLLWQACSLQGTNRKKTPARA